jgi:hypothetical protein
MNDAATLRQLARTRAQSLLVRGGAHAAELSTRPTSHRAILFALPAALERRFDPVVARDLQAVLELRLLDPAGAAATPFTLQIASGTCTVTRGAATLAGASVELGADDMIRLVTGGVGWPELLGSRRLTLSGDPFLALRFPQLFRLPAESA